MPLKEHLSSYCITWSSTSEVISSIQHLKSCLQLISCSVTYSSLFSSSILVFSSLDLSKIDHMNSAKPTNHWNHYWEAKEENYLSHLCWDADSTICCIRSSTMFAIFNPLSAWDSNLVCMADLEIHSYKIKHVKPLLQSQNNYLTQTLDKQMCLTLNGKRCINLHKHRDSVVAIFH